MSLTIGVSKGSGSVKLGNYARWLKEGHDDLEVVDLWLSADLDADLERIDALLLTGGSDVHPARYDQPELEPLCEDIDLERDEKEFLMLTAALAREIPVLAICRGLQLLNVQMGGTLHCHLPDLLEGSTGHLKDDQIDRNHHVEVTPGSLLFKATGELSGEVNSAHHQSISRLGEGLAVSARAEDGVIEAIELANQMGKPYLLGVQWHPERMSELQSAFSRGIREQFLFEAESSRILARVRKPEPREDPPPPAASDQNGSTLLPIIN